MVVVMVPVFDHERSGAAVAGAATVWCVRRPVGVEPGGSW
jgi:hypothetical protein